MKEKLKAFGYVRSAPSRQIDKGGPDRQREAIERHCKAAKIEIVRFYEDAVSAQLLRMNGLSSMKWSLIFCRTVFLWWSSNH